VRLTANKVTWDISDAPPDENALAIIAASCGMKQD
jgi:hypothetical protein